MQRRSLLCFIVIQLTAWGALAGSMATAELTMFPAGDFKATSSKVEGFAVRVGDGVKAENIKVDLRDIKTDNSLRDQHTKKYLNVDKHPQALLVKAVGRDGKGQAEVEINGVRKKVSGTYKIKGSELTASFPIKLSDFQITNVRYKMVGVEDDARVIVTVPVKSK